MKRFIPLITVLLIIAAYFSSCSSRSSKSINTYVDKLIPEHEVHPMQEDEIQTLLDNFDLNADDYGVSVTVVVWHDRNDQIAYIFECGCCQCFGLGIAVYAIASRPQSAEGILQCIFRLLVVGEQPRCQMQKFSPQCGECAYKLFFAHLSVFLFLLC